MKTLEIINALTFLGNLTCGRCHRTLIDDDRESTVIKKHIVKTYKKKGVIEIECRHCHTKNILTNNN